MPRAKSRDSDIAAIRTDIAELAKSLGQLQSEVTAARTMAGHAAKNGENGLHHVGQATVDGAEALMAGALNAGHGAAHVAEDAIHVGVSWIDDMLRKNPTPTMLTALGVGFVFGLMSRR